MLKFENTYLKKIKLLTRFNKNYFDIIQDDNFTFTGFYGELAETFELSNHIFFMGVQFHPEFKSTPWASSPPYQGLIDAAIKRKQNGN